MNVEASLDIFRYKKALLAQRLANCSRIRLYFAEIHIDGAIRARICANEDLRRGEGNYDKITRARSNDVGYNLRAPRKREPCDILSEWYTAPSIAAG